MSQVVTCSHNQNITCDWVLNRDIEFRRYLSIGREGMLPELRCPRCDSAYLHQGRVTVFDRAEDAKVTAVTTVEGGLAATHLRPSDEVANPSSGRHGLALAFECEGCVGGLELTIARSTQVREHDKMRQDFLASIPPSWRTPIFSINLMDPTSCGIELKSPIDEATALGIGRAAEQAFGREGHF